LAKLADHKTIGASIFAGMLEKTEFSDKTAIGAATKLSNQTSTIETGKELVGLETQLNAACSS